MQTKTFIVEIKSKHNTKAQLSRILAHELVENRIIGYTISPAEITIPMSENDCDDIKRNETFDWIFEGVDVHIKLENQDDLE